MAQLVTPRVAPGISASALLRMHNTLHSASSSSPPAFPSSPRLLQLLDFLSSDAATDVAVVARELGLRDEMVARLRCALDRVTCAQEIGGNSRRRARERETWRPRRSGASARLPRFECRWAPSRADKSARPKRSRIAHESLAAELPRRGRRLAYLRKLSTLPL